MSPVMDSNIAFIRKKPKYFTRRNSKTNQMFDLDDLDIEIKPQNVIKGTTSVERKGRQQSLMMASFLGSKDSLENKSRYTNQFDR